MGRLLSPTMFSTVSKAEIIVSATFVVCNSFEFGPVQKILVWLRVNPLPDDKILDWSKLKQIADNILKCI